MSLTISTPIQDENSLSSLINVTGNSTKSGSQTITATFSADPTSATFSEGSSLFSVSSNVQGVCTDGTNFFITNSTEIKKQNISGTVLDSSTNMTTLWDGESLTSCGDTFYKDGFIYLCGYKNTTGTSFVFKVDPSTLEAVDKWDLSASFTNSINTIFYHDGYWFIGEACETTSTTTYVKAFDDNFNFVKNSFSNSNDYGFQGAILWQDKMIITDHTQFYVARYNNDGTFTYLYTVTPNPTQQIQGMTTIGSQKYYLNRNAYLKEFDFIESHTYGSITESGDISSSLPTDSLSDAGDFSIWIRSNPNNYHYLQVSNGTDTDTVAFQFKPSYGESGLTLKGLLLTNTAGAVETN